MNGKQARKIRKEVYGDLSIRARKYTKDGTHVQHKDGTVKKVTGTIRADERRNAYQRAKKARTSL